jgi:hypothetical protein
MAFVISMAVPSLVPSADVAARRLSEERHRALVEHANDIVANIGFGFTGATARNLSTRVLGTVHKASHILGKVEGGLGPPMLKAAPGASHNDAALALAPGEIYRLALLTIERLGADFIAQHDHRDKGRQA